MQPRRADGRDVPGPEFGQPYRVEGIVMPAPEKPVQKQTFDPIGVTILRPQ
jgi:hypothetical protein